MVRVFGRLLAAALVLLVVPLQAAGAAAQEPPAGWTQEALARFGVQQVAKRQPTEAEVAGTAPVAGVNPYLVSGVQDADYYYWQTLLDERGEREAVAEARLAAPAPVVDELEPPDRLGGNDTLEIGQPIPELGTAEGEQREMRILGTLAPGTQPAPAGPFAEDDGAIPLANPTTLDGSGVSVQVEGTIGDGPHGTAGSGTGDFDFFLVAGAEAGQVLTVEADAPSALDPLVAVTDASGAILGVNDDEPTSSDSFLQVTLPADGDYYVALAAFGSLPTNPFDPASGTGATSEGAYTLRLGLDAVEDVDVFRFDLDAGDVLSSTVSGAATILGVFDPQGRQVMGSGVDLSAIYPDDTPLTGGGNAGVDHVAAVAGRHALVVNRGAGDYEARVRLLRPGLETDGPGARQVLFLDFDGAELNTNIFADAGVGVPGGVKTLSPAAAFLGGCGITPEQQDAVIDVAVAGIAENYGEDLEIRTSRDHPDPWGQQHVSRIVIGGSRVELGNPDITFNGIAETIDPGNFDQEETGLVLMDFFCAPSGSVPISLNDFVGPDSDVVECAGEGMAFVASHESGHYLGSWHTANESGVASIMDQFDLTQLGFGPDGFCGTADDLDVDFAEDAFNPFERLVGLEDTGTRSAVAIAPAAGETEVPAAPEDVVAVATARGARVRWSDLDQPVTGYVVRAVLGGAVVAEQSVGGDVTRARFRDLARGTYTFTVAAVNAAGEGPATASQRVRVG